MIDRSKLPNSFAFVITAGARARQLLAGSTPRVAVGQHKKVTVALQEVLTGEVEAIEPDRDAAALAAEWNSAEAAAAER
jgi:DNA-directed RNA polymerase omega subunit